MARRRWCPPTRSFRRSRRRLGDHCEGPCPEERAGDVRRSRWAEQAGASVGDVGEFELAVAHLRVPEMA
jgi:hypothetical protein